MEKGSDPLGSVRGKIEAHAEERRRLFVRGFARFVILRGSGAKAPAVDGQEKAETWQAVGRRLYGESLFNEVLREEIEAQRGAKHAKSRISSVRGDQGEVCPAGQAAGRGENPCGEDHECLGREGPAQPSEVTS